MVLYINACVRPESRTNYLAQRLLKKLGEYAEVNLETAYQEGRLKALDQERLALRTELIEAGDFSHSMFDYAKQFASADAIVIGAPFWDLSFPALLKLYVENIYVTNLVSAYGPDGRPVGLCSAKKLYYVTTAGGPYDGRFSYGQIEAMAKDYFGIEKTELIMAEMLDVEGFDPDTILADCVKEHNL